jgi:CHAT domain-containing protein
VLAVADPVFSSDDPRVTAPRLPHKSTSVLAPHLARLFFAGEIDTLSAMTPPARRVILRGFEANRRRMEAMHLGDFALLHFSTHALIDDRVPEFSRIALSLVGPNGDPEDGFIRPYHLGEFRLNGSVVVLSACGTALGKQVLGEGIAGFSGSLFHAGASQLVLTLAEIDAEASSDFFSEVYRQYLGKRPASMEHALTLARTAMSHSSRWSDPYYWASIIVIGRPAGLP